MWQSTACVVLKLASVYLHLFLYELWLVHVRALAALRLAVCSRFIGEADEQSRHPEAARQLPELYLS